MEEIRLDGSGNSLVLTCAADGWCQVELHAPDGILPIGVQSTRYIASRLTNFFRRAKDEPQCVLFLPERNVCVHGKRLEDVVLFRFEDAKGAVLGGFSLDAFQEKAWLELLLPYV